MNKFLFKGIDYYLCDVKVLPLFLVVKYVFVILLQAEEVIFPYG